ncbi:U3 small nucleolar RNA-associated protein 14 homolog A [Lepisosteus oculatus]|uniref:U3 small nucleolar RNA-associated protein 14 homolog A n=1 Tax=Lepisosteus oculatus TaxID=7918 RepID=UPI00371EB7E9
MSEQLKKSEYDTCATRGSVRQTVNMAKKRKVASGETASKTSKKKASQRDAAPGVVEEEFLPTEHADSASEDEGRSDNERKHQKLLEAIGSLDGTKRKKLAERSEASAQVSEFAVSAEGAGEKIDLSDLLGTMQQARPSISRTRKQLRNLQNCKATLDLPLSQQETQKIQRVVAYKKSREDVSRWKNVVIQNRKAEQLVFPLNQEPSGPRPVEQVVAGWKARTPLEQEIFSLLHKNLQPITSPVLTPHEQASLKAMSLEEAKMHRAELQKARALQSYYEAKTKREKKIKSKTYHKVLKKSKRKDVLKEFEELRKTNPAAALEELKKMELTRMKERMSLKHQNSGKWAKSRAIMAKYDEEARKAMQQQLEMNKQLTQKLAVPSDSEEEEGAGEAEAVPDFVNDAQPAADPSNPWLMGKLRAEPAAEEGAEERAEEKPEAEQQQQEEEEEEQEGEEDALLREFEERRQLREAESPDQLLPPEKGEKSEEADMEEEEVSEFNSLFQRLVGGRREPPGKRVTPKPRREDSAPPADEGAEREQRPLLDEGPMRVQTLEDLDLLSQGVTGESDGPAPECKAPGPSSEGEGRNEGGQEVKKKKKKVISLSQVLTKEAKVIQVPVAPTAIEEEEGEEVQKMIIKEAFAGDDVISDFLKDKRRQAEESRPKVVDLTLPGWGEWGGVGLKPSKRKSRRFRIKAAPPPPRQDRNLPDVIISEKRDASIAAHQVAQLPFPFENPTQFERSVRMPVGQTWNTQRSVQKITAPRVVTQLGAIIEPMAKEDFLQGKSAQAAGKLPDIALTSSGGDPKKRAKGFRKKGAPRHREHQKDQQPSEETEA